MLRQTIIARDFEAHEGVDKELDEARDLHSAAATIDNDQAARGKRY